MSASANPTVPQRNRLSLWIQAVRAFSFTASVIPVLVGGLFALGATGPKRWALLPLAVLGGLLLHAGTNLINDYYDFQRGVDREGTFGSSGILVAGLMPPRSIFLGALVAFGLTVAIGVVLVAERGWPMLLLGGTGLLGGYLYSGRPVGYKYLALGDLLVFVLMGPLMVLGGYLTVTGQFRHEVLLLSLPIGCLVAGILCANNLRDIEHDGEAKIITLARLLGHRAGKVEYTLLVLGAYASVAVLVPAKVLSPWTLLVLLSSPLAVKNLSLVLRSREGEARDLAFADVQTAQLHMVFGVLLGVGIVLGATL
ncbi:MAG: 1,4-dihydroxy-2-naphthoate octaprenyltransferase [bacterium]